MTDDIKINKAVLNAFSILDAISAADTSIGVSELTRETGLPKTTVFRLLSTLEYANVVEANADQQYRIGPRLFSYMKSVDHQSNLIKTVTPYMKKFADKTKENINIGILYENEVLYLHSEEGEKFSLQVNLFPVAPLYCSSMGKIFLNDFSDEKFENYVNTTNLRQRTINTITDPDKLKSDLVDVNENKIAYDNEEYEYGLTCMAVPLYHEGKLIASASVSGPTTRLKVRGWEFIKENILSFGENLNELL